MGQLVEEKLNKTSKVLINASVCFYLTLKTKTFKTQQ